MWGRAGGRRKDHEILDQIAGIGTVVVAASAATNPLIAKPRAERGADLSGAPSRADASFRDA
jgi:hypothetical protein